MSGNNNAHTIQIPDRDKTPHNFPLIQPTDTDINLFLADLSSDDKMSTGNPTMESNLTFDAGSNNSFSTEEARQSTSKRFVNNIPSLDEIANYNNTRSTANRTFGSSILNSSYLDKDSIRKFESQIQSQNMFQPFDSPSPASQIPLPRQKFVKNNSYEIKLKNTKNSNNFTASEFLDLPALQTDFETKTITSTTQFANPVVDSTTEDFSNINIKTNDTEFFDFLNNHDSALKTTEDFTSSINPDSFVSNTVPAINPNMIPDTINDMHEFIIPYDQPAPSLNGNQTIDLQTSGLHDLGRPEINIEYVDINPSNLTFLDRPVSSLSTDSTDYNNRFNTSSASHLLSPEHNNSTLLSPSSASPYDNAPHKQFSFDSVVSGMGSPKTPGNANILRVPTNDEHNQMRIGRQHLRSRSRSGSRTGSRSRSGSNLSIRSPVSGFTDPITYNGMNLSPSKVPMTIKDDDSFYSDIENETDRDNHGGEGAEEGSLLNCEFCGKKFSKPYSLKSHMKTHNDDKPYKCKICGKPFARTHDRKRHEDLHSGIKRFQCKGILPNGEFWGCEKRFARTDALRRHFYTESGKNCISPLLSGNMIRRDDDKDFEAESVAFAMENSIALMKKSSSDSKK